MGAAVGGAVAKSGGDEGVKKGGDLCMRVWRLCEPRWARIGLAGALRAQLRHAVSRMNIECLSMFRRALIAIMPMPDAPREREYPDVHQRTTNMLTCSSLRRSLNGSASGQQSSMHGAPQASHHAGTRWGDKLYNNASYVWHS